jgi:hypothetical protein
MYTAWGDFTRIVKRPIKERIVVEEFNNKTEFNEFNILGKSENNTILFKSKNPPISFIEPGGSDRLVSKRKGSCVFAFGGPPNPWYITINGDDRVIGPYTGDAYSYFDIWAGDRIIVKTDYPVTKGWCNIEITLSTSTSPCNVMMAPDFATVDTRLITTGSCIWEIAPKNMSHQSIYQNQALYCYCLNDQMPNVDVPRIDLPTKDKRTRDKLNGTY